MPKKVLIPFSGGLDSTYLVYKNLKEGNEVFLAHFKIANNEDKFEREFLAIKDIYSKLKERFPDSKLWWPFREDLNGGQITYQTVEFIGDHMISGPQPPIWVFCLAYHEDLPYVDEVQMGYVIGDEAISYLPEINKLYRSLAPFMKKTPPPLKFPLIKEHKWVIWGYLPDNIKKDVVFCESATEDRYSPCGDCVPCLSFFYNNLWESWHELNDVTPKFVLEEKKMRDDRPEFMDMAAEDAPVNNNNEIAKNLGMDG